MTQPNTELDREIEEHFNKSAKLCAEELLKNLDDGRVTKAIEQSFQPFLLAAKRVPQLEKENEALTMAVQQWQDVADQLRTAYKEALEAFEELKWHDLRDSHMASDCFVCERINKALSNPLAIEVMKEKKV